VDIKAELATSVAAEATAQAAYDDAALDGVENGDDRAAPAAQELGKATARVTELRAAIAAAEKREARRVDSERAADLAARWNAVKAGNKARETAAADIETHTAALLVAWNNLKSATETIGAARVVTDLDGGLLRAADIEAALRLSFVRLGFRWAASFPWAVEQIPPLTKRIADASAHIGAQRRG
jgi:hypothetical protein